MRYLAATQIVGSQPYTPHGGRPSFSPEQDVLVARMRRLHAGWDAIAKALGRSKADTRAHYDPDYERPYEPARPVFHPAAKVEPAAVVVGARLRRRRPALNIVGRLSGGDPGPGSAQRRALNVVARCGGVATSGQVAEALASTCARQSVGAALALLEGRGLLSHASRKSPWLITDASRDFLRSLDRG